MPTRTEALHGDDSYTPFAPDLLNFCAHLGIQRLLDAATIGPSDNGSITKPVQVAESVLTDHALRQREPLPERTYDPYAHRDCDELPAPTPVTAVHEPSGD